MRRLYVAAMAVFRVEFPGHPGLQLAPFNEPPFLQWAPDAYARICLRRGARKSLTQQLEDAQKEIERLKSIIAAVPATTVMVAEPPPSPPPTPEPVAVPVLSTGRTVQDVLADWGVLFAWRGYTTRELDVIQRGLGQRLSRTRRVVCLHLRLVWFSLEAEMSLGFLLGIVSSVGARPQVLGGYRSLHRPTKSRNCKPKACRTKKLRPHWRLVVALERRSICLAAASR